MTPWLFLLQTDHGVSPFALTLTEGGCRLLILLFRAAGAVGTCAPYIPGVPA